MRSQFFVNDGGRYRELFAADIGEFFDIPLLGRGLATLDWNRDGLTDVLASNIGEPAALLTNRSRDVGAGLSLQLVGVSGARDAIGARVVVTVGDQSRERQLTAGDGYQASNERRLNFGCGAVRDDDTATLEIHWPHGERQRIEGLPVRGEYLIVEGRPPLTCNP
ncbi:MAG: hypothetical protein B7Z55_02285 [Planctomycetales bacterium 12-60-4]|nr:MAG: hypothetical protein B7Z55_02285 [Planctomycetales bacterium 12-60-4]